MLKVATFGAKGKFRWRGSGPDADGLWTGYRRTRSLHFVRTKRQKQCERAIIKLTAFFYCYFFLKIKKLPSLHAKRWYRPLLRGGVPHPQERVSSESEGIMLHMHRIFIPIKLVICFLLFFACHRKAQPITKAHHRWCPGGRRLYADTEESVLRLTTTAPFPIVSSRLKVHMKP
jgi:hypothetical protein